MILRRLYLRKGGDVLDISSYTAVVTSLTTALASSVPTIMTAVGAIGGGIIAFGIGFRLVRRFVK